MIGNSSRTGYAAPNFHWALCLKYDPPFFDAPLDYDSAEAKY